jgi:hypothetical protein
MFAILRYSQTRKTCWEFQKIKMQIWWESELAVQVRRLFMMRNYRNRGVNFRV